MVVIVRGRLQSPALLIEGDAFGALLLGDAEKFSDVGRRGGDDWGLSAVASLISDEGDLNGGAVI